MDHQNGPILIIKTRAGDCTVIHNDVSLLKGSHNNVRKLFRKLVESAGIPNDYDVLERELYENEPRPPQGAYNTKNAVRSLRDVLFPFAEKNGTQKWINEIVTSDGKPLLRLEKPHASRICLTWPQPVGDADVYLDLEPQDKPCVSPIHTNSPPFTVPITKSRYFYGRDGVLTDLHNQLKQQPYVAVCGAGGIGKTQLAAEYAHIFRESYPGGVYWIDAKDVQSVREAFAVLSRDFDEFRAPQDLPIEDRAKRVRERFQQMSESSLLILDSLTADQKLLHLLPTTGRCHILATTRHHSLLKSRFHVVDLLPLDVHSALQALQCCCTIYQSADRLVAAEPGLRREEAVAREQAAIEGISNELNQRLPLTMTLIAFYVYQRKTTFEECRRRLEANSLKVFERADVEYSIHDAFKLSTSELTDQALRVLATAACFARRNISRDLLREAASIDDIEEFEDATTLLDLSSFITVEVDGRITLHDVLRDITLEQIDAEERNRLLQRTADTLVARMERANETMAWDSVAAEVVQCRAVIDSCRRHRQNAQLVALLCELGQYYRLHDETKTALGYYDEAARTLTTYMPGDLRMLAKCKMQLSATDPAASGAVTNARRALSLARKGAASNDLDLAEYYNVVGYVLDTSGHPWRALPFYRRALHLCETIAGRQSVPAAEYLNNIAVLSESKEDYHRAAEHLAEALDIFMHIYGENHRRAAIALNNLGRVQRGLGDSANALESHNKALKIFETYYGRETKDSAMSLYFAGLALTDIGDELKAKSNARTALDILERRYGKDDFCACRVRQWLEIQPRLACRPAAKASAVRDPKTRLLLQIVLS